jgi:hypothetical protein
MVQRLLKLAGFCVVFLVMRLRGHDCIYGTSGLLAAQWVFDIDGRTNVEHIIGVYIFTGEWPVATQLQQRGGQRPIWTCDGYIVHIIWLD